MVLASGSQSQSVSSEPGRQFENGKIRIEMKDRSAIAGKQGIWGSPTVDLCLHCIFFGSEDLLRLI
ncbi:hypothetical protein RMSM_00610 [Rhodopirellula maiorica SM1]|uniref:Uncharacterized protein n=1 Tax=Rhodopirellula maiorica SM1 TaxID=1265738 RepID=M5RTD5_9BACT|nr:hypothetical protein RMSM_00610 [Rhodopirellula maiorica SM1]